MAYTIHFEQDARNDLKQFRKAEQVKILKAIKLHLSHEPTQQSQSRIKQLRQGTQPPYRLRIDEFRVYYDVEDKDGLVIIYGIVHKRYSQNWLDTFNEENRGSPYEND